MKLSVVIPARDEEASIAETLTEIAAALEREDIEYEVIVVDDGSTDATASRVAALGNPHVQCVPSPYSPGFGLAVRAGLETFTSDAVAVMMADGSDSPADLVRYYRLLEDGYDCAFGSRFVAGAVVQGYPRLKLIVNRLANGVVRLLFRHGYNDTTNAFKAYRREAVDVVQPLLSNHFNLTVELPLKAIVRGCSYGIIPISWTNRRAGASKLKLQEMGSRYLFIVLYVFLERHLSGGDYHRGGAASKKRLRPGLQPTTANRRESVIQGSRR
jgi:dolichol-phosphate mannosyltransferase